MSCWYFFIFMWVKGMDNIPTECIYYTDDPGVYEVVRLPSYIEEDEINGDGDSSWNVV